MSPLPAVAKAITQERLFAIVVLLICGVAYWQTFMFAPDTFTLDLSRGDTYPRIVIGFTSILALIAVARNWRKTSDKADGKAASAKEKLRSYARPALVVALFTLYLGVLGTLGFVLSTAVFLIAAQLIIMRERTIKLIVVAIIISLLAPFAIDYVFSEIIRIFLP